ncbi:MAG: branched-chain amino acid transport system ATP-binding protein livM [Thermosediminibacterales bacterium]|nr:branched-chain amino acid transport system ATP-binding protein livM [Thermosediminibacterales bacterium]MDK2836537.1 branched-chain amino acid transport system ATP-binding protein livM [Thermosediminibacterales bacterium]
MKTETNKETLISPQLYVPVLFFVLLFLIPLVIKNPFYIHNMILIFFYAALSSAWNIIGGFAGQISLGHAAFFGIGAYTSAILYVDFGISPWIGMLAGGVLAMLVAAGISYPCFKLRGPFFTLSTIAFGEVVRLLVSYFRDITRGAVGLLVPFKPGIGNLMFRGKIPYYYFALILMILVVVVSKKISVSRMGFYLTSLREDEEGAQAIGINTSLYKLWAVMISAFFAGIAGVFYAQYILFIEPESVFSSAMSTQFALMSIIGGMGTVAGPVVGSFILTPLSEFLRSTLGGSFQGLHFAIYGVLLIIVVILMPQGIVVWFKDKYEALLERLPNEKRREVKS